jgi:tetratricopeptide (TPR) repeat protein
MMLAGFGAVLPFVSNPGLVAAGPAGQDAAAKSLELQTRPVEVPPSPSLKVGETADLHPLNPGQETETLFVPEGLVHLLPSLVAQAAASPENFADNPAVLATLEKTLGLSRAQVINFCRIIGNAGLDPTRIGNTLQSMAAEQRRLLASRQGELGRQLAAGESGSPLHRAVEAGDFIQADKLTRDIERHGGTVPSHRSDLSGALYQELRGQVSWFLLRLRRSADHFREAARLVPAIEESKRRFYLQKAAEALYLHGEAFSDDQALEEAIQQYRTLAGEYDPQADPAIWGTVQSNLGRALWDLGSREASPVLLEQAVEAYRNALLVRSPVRTPVPWLRAQYSLAVSLSALGKAAEDPSYTKQAIAAYRAVLQEEAVPEPERTRSQVGLGSALLDLGTRWNDQILLREAVAVFDAALKAQSRERILLDWASVKDKLGHALFKLGWAAQDPGNMALSVAAYRDALAGQSPRHDPVRWARRQASLGSALMSLGALESSNDHLQQAVEAHRIALSILKRDRLPLDWARVQANLGIALRALALGRNDPSLLAQALDATKDARDAYMDSGMVHLEVFLTNRIIDWEAELAMVGKEAVASRPADRRR